MPPAPPPPPGSCEECAAPEWALEMGYVADRKGDCKLMTPAWADDVFPYLSTLAGGSKGPLTLCFGRSFNAAGEYNCDNKPQNQSLISAYFAEYFAEWLSGGELADHQYIRHTSVIAALAAQPSINCLESPPPTPPVTMPPSPPPAPHCTGRVPKDPQQCQALAEYLGLGIGGHTPGKPEEPLPFENPPERVKGCFAYTSCSEAALGVSGYCGNAFFGMGGSDREMESYFGSIENGVQLGETYPKYRLVCPPSSDYGYDSSPPSAPPSSPPFCGFTVLPLERTVGAAFAECEALGAQPAKISNAYENAMLLHELRAVAERENIPVKNAWLGVRELTGKLEGSYYWIADGTVLDDPKVFRFWDRYPSSCEDRSAAAANHFPLCMGQVDSPIVDLLKLSGRCDDVPDHRCPTHPTCLCNRWTGDAVYGVANSERYRCARECAANATRRTRVTHGPRITSYSNWQQWGNPSYWNPNPAWERDHAFPDTKSWVTFETSGCSRSSEESAPGPVASACGVGGPGCRRALTNPLTQRTCALRAQPVAWK